VTWDFEGGGYCCPDCGRAFTRLGGHVVEQLDWQVVIRLVVDDDVPVVPVDRFLAYLTDVGRSPNTVKAYAHDLNLGSA
jgi:hypothetical protein